MNEGQLVTTTVACPGCGAEATVSYRDQEHEAANAKIYMCPNMCPMTGGIGTLIGRSDSYAVPVDAGPARPAPRHE